MRRQPVVVALVVGIFALVGPPAAPAPATPRAPQPVATPVQPAPAGDEAESSEAGDGLQAQAATTFVVDPEARAVHATIEATLTNTLADRPQGDMIQRFYFFKYAIPVLSEATNARATKADGTALQVQLVPSEDAAQRWVEFAEITLQPRLLYNDTQTIKLTYDLPYQGPRSDGLSRANDALVMFPAFSPGDSGHSSIEVQLPSRFSVEVVGDALEQEERDGTTVLTATEIENPATFTPIVVATDDAELLTDDIQVEGRDVELRAWPDDQAWADFVGQQLGDIMPALDTLVGQPWPTDRGLEVIETASPYAHGYAGWYDQVDHSISLGDELDALVIAHELSHVWFNATLFDARWINEGFADEYAQTTLEQLGQDPPAATAPDRDGPGAVALNAWSTPSLLEQQDDAVEAYAYAASGYVLDQIATEIGVDRLREVVDAVSDDRIPYVGDPEAEDVHGVANWRRLLDQLENVGGSERATELFARYVVDGDEANLLTARTEARAVYAGLAERGDGWTPPLAVRLAMTNWDFPGAGRAVIEANGVLDTRETIDEVLDGLDVGPLALEDSYESARGLTDLAAEATDTLDAARAYRTADERMDAGPGLVGRIGLLGSGTGDRLDDAADELAGGDPAASLAASATVQDRLDGATRNGLIRLAGLFLLLVLAGVVLERRLHRRTREERRHRSDAAEIAQLEALYARPCGTPSATDTRTIPIDPDRPDWPN